MASVILPDGEQHKTLATVERVLDALVERRLNRDACVVALGGGVIGDMAGFAAACYQRGIDFVQVPTTLLAQVDSSVGGKTGVNHPGGKNMIGAFHQPRAVICGHRHARHAAAARAARRPRRGHQVRPDRRRRLSSRGSKRNLDALLGLDAAALTHAIRRSCEIKAGIVAEDEREHGRRALLNLGHTFGHAIETAAGYGAGCTAKPSAPGW